MQGFSHMMIKKEKIQALNTLPHTEPVTKYKKKDTAELILTAKKLISEKREKEIRAAELAEGLRTEISKLKEQVKPKSDYGNTQYAFLSHVNRAIIHDTNEEMLFQHICNLAIKMGRFRMAWIGHLDTVHKNISPLNHSGITAEDMHHIAEKSYNAKSPQRQIAETGSHYICNNIDLDPLFEKGKPFFEKHGIRSCIILPIKKSGKIYASLNLYSDKADFFKNNDIALLNEAAEDITFGIEVFEKRKQYRSAELLLKKSEEFNRGVLNSLSSHIAVINSTGKIIAVNEAWKRFAAENGANNAESTLTGANYFDECENALRGGNDTAGKVLEGMKSVSEGKEKVFYLEYPCHSPSQKRWYGMRVIKFDCNTPMLVVSHVNISERKFAEENLAKSEAGLKEAQTIASTGSWEIALQTNIVTWSDEIYNILDVKKTQEPSAELFLSCIHPEDQSNTRKRIKKSFTSPEISSTDFRFIKKDGSIRHACIERKMDFDEHKKIIRLYGILQDITERKAAEEVREKLTEDLIQRNRELEQFTFMLSHDLRAPTANIIGFAENLKQENLSNEDQKVCLMGLSKSVERLDTIIKDINTILKLKGDVNEKKETIHFSKLAADIVQGMENFISENQIRILTDFSAIDEIYSIRIYFHSIFYNLISNSIKYRNSRVKSFIEIKSQNENEVVTLVFNDNGLGLNLKAKEGVFGLYKRFHTHIEGKGMGLFMVKTQVESLGGTIKVESEINKGTKFTVVFPKQLIIK